MQIVVITMVRNEADVIEAFARFHLAFADRMIVVVHRAIDGTLEILEALRDDGLPIEILRETALHHPQDVAMTERMREVGHAVGADGWVLPLDADEFVTGTAPVREILEGAPRDRPLRLPWSNYVPLPGDPGDEPHVLRRIRHRRRPKGDAVYKVAVPAPVATRRGVWLAYGNHEVMRKPLGGRRTALPSASDERLALAHFPVRSARQIRAKVFVHWLSTAARPNRGPDQGFHQKAMFDRFKRGEELGADELARLAIDYGEADPSSDPGRDVELAPVGIPEAAATLSRLDLERQDPLRLLADSAEEMALALGSVRR